MLIATATAIPEKDFLALYIYEGNILTKSYK